MPGLLPIEPMYSFWYTVRATAMGSHYSLARKNNRDKAFYLLHTKEKINIESFTYSAGDTVEGATFAPSDWVFFFYFASTETSVPPLSIIKSLIKREGLL